TLCLHIRTKPRGCGVRLHILERRRRVSHFRFGDHGSQLTRFQQLAASLFLLGSLLRPPILCFQSVAASFAKTGGWVGVQGFLGLGGGGEGGGVFLGEGGGVMRDFCTAWR